MSGRSLDDVLAAIDPERRRMIEERFAALVKEEEERFRLSILDGRHSDRKSFAAAEVGYFANAVIRRVRGKA